MEQFLSIKEIVMLKREDGILMNNKECVKIELEKEK
jgi:hypothetical protein